MDDPLRPPVKYALFCSENSLGDLSLATLTRASHVRKQLIVSLDELVRLEAEALFVRWMIEHRAELLELARGDGRQETLQFPETKSPSHGID